MAWIAAVIALVLTLINKFCKKNDTQEVDDTANAEETGGIMASLWDGVTDIGEDVSEGLSNKDGSTNWPLVLGASVGLASMIDPEDGADATERVRTGIVAGTKAVTVAAVAPVEGAASGFLSTTTGKWLLALIIFALVWWFFSSDDDEEGEA
jgi:hypothetical protein